MKSKFRRKKKPISFFLPPPFLFFVLLIFQPGIYSSMAHPIPFQNALKGSHLWVPSCWYISKRPCKVTLIVLTVCTYLLLHTAARLSCFFFFSFLQVIILHCTQIFVYSQLRGSQPRSLPAIRALKAEMFWSNFSVGNTFHTYQVISCVQMGPTHTTLLKLAPLQIPSTVAWVGCRRFEHITFSVIFADVWVVDCTN